MFSTIILALLFITTVATFVFARKSVTVDGKTLNFKLFGFVPLLIGLVWALLSCTAIVQAKQVGVITTFGKPSEHTAGSGLTFKAPWQKVTEIDATIQTDEYRDDHCIKVRLGDGNTACVFVTNRWHVNQDNANLVYANYRSDDPTQSLRDAVVSTQFKATVNQVFGSYNPTADLAAVDLSNPKASIAGVSFSPDYNEFSDTIMSQMKSRLGNDPLVILDGVTVSYLQLDDKTQARINDFIAEVGKTQIALQAQATAVAQARANEILSKSLSNDPNVLVSRCFDLLADGYQVPAGFSCWQNGGSAVVVPSAQK